MIIKGKSRSGPAALAAHLGNAEKNERIELIETRGTVADDLRGALTEMDACAVGTRCEKPLYHAAISPEPPHRLTPEQRIEAVDALEAKLGLHGHARVVVVHEKEGREHLHAVWSRIDLNQMKSVSDSHNYRKHEEVARDLERRFGHDRVQGAHHEREGIERPDRTPSRSELRQEERTGISGKLVRQEVSAAFRESDGPEAFRAALDDRGYLIAKGDRRDFVIVDPAGGIHSLARRLDGIKAAELREFMAPLDRDSLPNIERAQEIAEERQKRAAELDAAHEQARIDKAYGRGDDYVSQTRAAQKDFQRRQEQLLQRTERSGELTRDSGPGVATADEDRDRRDGKASDQGANETRQTSADSSSLSLGDVELTEAMQERLDRLLDSGGAVRRDAGRDDSGRQREAPGGGRTRSR